MEQTIIDVFLAMAQPPGDGQGAGGMTLFSCLLPVAFLGIFYALLIRPQQQQQKEHEKLVSEIKSGERVIAAGIVGTIVTVKKDTIVVKSSDTKIELARNSIERVITDDDDSE